MTGVTIAPAGNGADHAASPDFVQSLARGLAVITAFDAERPRQTLSDVARSTGLTRATAAPTLPTSSPPERMSGFDSPDGSRFQSNAWPPPPYPATKASTRMACAEGKAAAYCSKSNPGLIRAALT